jgi:hypothetical protein
MSFAWKIRVLASLCLLASMLIMLSDCTGNGSRY